MIAGIRMAEVLTVEILGVALLAIVMLAALALPVAFAIGAVRWYVAFRKSQWSLPPRFRVHAEDCPVGGAIETHH